MYLQAGDEGHWLKQQRRSMEAEAANRLATTSSPSRSRRAPGMATIDRNFRAALGDAGQAAVGRALCLLRSSLASSGSRP